MRLNENNEDHDQLGSLMLDDIGTPKAYDACIQVISEVLIQPMDSKLDTDEKLTLGLIKQALDIIAKKAIAYERVFEKGDLPENSQN